MSSISGILLAGGKSSRMGSNKAFLKIKNRDLYEFPLSLLREYCDDIIISAPVDYFNSNDYRIIPDIIPDLGPIGGIYSCLPHIRNEKALVLSCDIPFISKDYCQHLISLYNKQDIIVGLNNDNYPEPLAAIYSVNILGIINQQLEDKNYKMSDLIKNCKAEIFSIQEAGFSRKIFMNINTKEDFEKAKKLYS